jgi:SAM-dependent methyltransferase
MAEFYQEEYQQPGLTTDLPDDDHLEALLATGFEDSNKSFSRVVQILTALGLTPGARVLDYGASWGYGTYQLRAAGYRAEAFEISEPRAIFGRKLGIEIHTRLGDVPGEFDAVYSSHVLEHVANARVSIVEQLARLRPGGYLIAHTPNGSVDRQTRDFASFHAHWGLVHPTLLTERFILSSFSAYPSYISTAAGMDAIRKWDRNATTRGPLEGDELIIILANQRTNL